MGDDVGDRRLPDARWSEGEGVWKFRPFLKRVVEGNLHNVLDVLLADQMRQGAGAKRR